MNWRSFFLPKPGPFILRLALLAGIFPILGWLGGGWWFFDLFNHFQRQYAAVLILCLATLLAMRHWKLALAAGLLLLVPLIRLCPSYFPRPAENRGSPLRIATFNVLSANTRHSDTVRWVRETDPDLIFLPEVDPAWAIGLRPLRESHPHVIEHIVEGNFGFALYSKLPILSREIIPCGALELPLLKAVLRAPAGDFTLLGAHPVPPASAFWAAERDIFLRIIADETAKAEGIVIVAGDLNATPWSHGMKPLFAAGLKDSANGYGAGGTWMRGNPLLAIPIDHILFRGHGVSCQKRWIGPDLGSDHRPVVADLAW